MSRQRPKRKLNTAEKVKTPFYRWFVLPVTYGIYRVMRSLLDRLSPNQVYSVARFFAAIAWHTSSHHRGRVIRNLELAYGDRFTPSERHKIARRVLDHFFMTTMDLVLVPRLLGGDKWRNVVDMTPEQESQLRELASYDGPVVFHTGHMGSWEMGGALPNLFGKTMHFVYRPLEHPQVDQDVRRLRTVAGNQVFAKQGALRGYTRTLKEGGWLGVIADQNAGHEAAYLDFFGVAASTEVRFFPLYQRFNTRMVAAFVIRQGNQFRFTMEGPFEVKINREADPKEEAMRLGQWYLDQVRAMAEKYPEQYLWTHKRYGARPAGIPHLYNDLFKPIDPAILKAQPIPPVMPVSWDA